MSGKKEESTPITPLEDEMSNSNPQADNESIILMDCSNPDPGNSLDARAVPPDDPATREEEPSLIQSIVSKVDEVVSNAFGSERSTTKEDNERGDYIAGDVDEVETTEKQSPLTDYMDNNDTSEEELDVDKSDELRDKEEELSGRFNSPIDETDINVKPSSYHSSYDPHYTVVNSEEYEYLHP